MKFVIGDIHGCRDTLQALLGQIVLTRKDHLYFLGDYIDRGKNSKGVLDLIMGLSKICRVSPLMGNHEHMMLLGYGYNNAYSQCWEMNGKESTLKSFPTYPVIPESYLAWCNTNLHKILKVGDYYLVHANIDPDQDNPMDSGLETLYWDRENYDTPHKIICGHTPKSLEAIKASLKTNKIFLDGGCVFKHKPEYGNLVALCLDTMELIVQRNVERD